jgi:hypothetical protein
MGKERRAVRGKLTFLRWAYSRKIVSCFLSSAFLGSPAAKLYHASSRNYTILLACSNRFNTQLKVTLAPFDPNLRPNGALLRL